jgi:hypothetical protein
MFRADARKAARSSNGALERMKTVRLALLTAAIGAAIAASWLLVQGSRSAEWPFVQGHILSSYVATFGAGLPTKAGHTDTYAPLVRYEYVVGSQKYQGTSIALWDATVSWRNLSERELARLSSSGAVKVFYEPNNPRRAVLIPGVPINVLSQLLFVIAACLLLYWLAPRVPQWLMTTGRQ